MRPRSSIGRRSLACAAIWLAATSGGCSVAFVNGPPPQHKKLAFFGCTSSNGVPMVDTGLAALFALDAVAYATGSTSTSTGTKTGDVIGLGLVAAALGASAAYGFHTTAECRDAQADLLQRTPPTPAFIPAPRPVYDPWVAHPVGAAAPTGQAWPNASPAAPSPPAPSPPAPPPPSAPPPAPSSPWEAAPPAK